MWQGTGSTNKWNLSCYSPRVPAVLFGLRLFVRRGGARQRQQWLLKLLPTRAERRWQMLWQGPRLGFVAKTGRFVTGRLEYDFLAFVPCSLHFLFSPSLSRYVYLLRVPSSVQQSSASLSKYVVYSTCFSPWVICILPHVGIPEKKIVRFVFSYILFLGWRFFVVLKYPVR